MLSQFKEHIAHFFLPINQLIKQWNIQNIQKCIIQMLWQSIPMF